MEFGIFFGGTAAQYDACVDRGLLSKGKRTAKEEADSTLAIMEQHNHDPAGTVNARKGWELAQQQVDQRRIDLTQERCNTVAAQWRKVLTMMRPN
jgi:hypothetical protein